VSPPRRPERAEAPDRIAGGVLRVLPFDGDDAALVGAMRSGRMDAATAFYDRHVGIVRTLVFRLMGPDPEVDDVVHDVFVRALESLHRLREAGSLRAWLMGIATRAVGIRFQKRRRQRWLRFMAPEDVPDRAATATPATELGEALRELYAILGSMDPDERIAFVLRCVEGLSLEDGARAAGTSMATFRRRIARAEAKFFARARSRPALDAWLGSEEKR
jgi:RNA polymerase sigma-70 factor (ECF subfamily)